MHLSERSFRKHQFARIIAKPGELATDPARLVKCCGGKLAVDAWQASLRFSGRTELAAKTLIMLLPVIKPDGFARLGHSACGWLAPPNHGICHKRRHSHAGCTGQYRAVQSREKLRPQDDLARGGSSRHLARGSTERHQHPQGAQRRKGTIEEPCHNFTRM